MMYPWILPANPYPLNAKQRRRMRRACRKNKWPMRLADPRPFRYDRLMSADGTDFVAIKEPTR